MFNQLSSQGETALVAEEGEVLKAYRCPAGVLTIGVGLTAASGVVKPTKGMTITRTESRRCSRPRYRENTFRASFDAVWRAHSTSLTLNHVRLQHLADSQRIVGFGVAYRQPRHSGEVGMQEQTAQLMKAIESIGMRLDSRLDGVNERLDRLYESKPPGGLPNRPSPAAER